MLANLNDDVPKPTIEDKEKLKIKLKAYYYNKYKYMFKNKEKEKKKNGNKNSDDASSLSSVLSDVSLKDINEINGKKEEEYHTFQYNDDIVIKAIKQFIEENCLGKTVSENFTQFNTFYNSKYARQNSLELNAIIFEQFQRLFTNIVDKNIPKTIPSDDLENLKNQKLELNGLDNFSFSLSNMI